MSDTVIVALLSLAGTLFGSGLGVIASSRLTVYRLEQLEKKVQAHHNLVERTYKLEVAPEGSRHAIRDLKTHHPPMAAH